VSCCHNHSSHAAACNIITAGDALRGYLPAACPTVAAVTALDETGAAAAGFSNFLSLNGASPEDQARVIAAPGSKIRSTISYAKVRVQSLLAGCQDL
jgi:hypothetical protein